MGFRFRKSFKIGLGLRINLSKSGTSLSIGGKGLTHNISTKGSRTTVGIPGTGLSYTTSSKSTTSANSQSNATPLQIPGSSPLIQSNKLTGSRVLILIACTIISIWGILAHYSDEATQALPIADSFKATPPPIASTTNEMPSDPILVSPTQNSPIQNYNIIPAELEVTPVENEGGFMLADTDAKPIPSMDAPTDIKIKSGSEILIKGTTRNGFWILLSEPGKDEEYYVPANNVAKFSK